MGAEFSTSPPFLHLRVSMEVLSLPLGWDTSSLGHSTHFTSTGLRVDEVWDSWDG